MMKLKHAVVESNRTNAYLLKLEMTGFLLSRHCLPQQVEMLKKFGGKLENQDLAPGVRGIRIIRWISRRAEDQESNRERQY